MIKQSELVYIDNKLRLILFGISCHFEIDMNSQECNRIFSDRDCDQVNTKSYILYSNNNLIITADVDEYEPESIFITISSKRPFNLKWLIEKAIYSSSMILNSAQQGDAPEPATNVNPAFPTPPAPAR